MKNTYVVIFQGHVIYEGTKEECIGWGNAFKELLHDKHSAEITSKRTANQYKTLLD